MQIHRMSSNDYILSLTQFLELSVLDSQEALLAIN